MTSIAGLLVSTERAVVVVNVSAVSGPVARVIAGRDVDLAIALSILTNFQVENIFFRYFFFCSRRDRRSGVTMSRSRWS